MERSAELLNSNSNASRGIATFACELERGGFLRKHEKGHVGRNVQHELCTNRLHLRKIRTLLNSCDFATKLVRYDAADCLLLLTNLIVAL